MSSVPKWIEAEMAKDDRAKAQNDAHLQQVVEDGLFVEANANGFFQKVIGQFDRQVKGLSGLGITGNLLKFGNSGRETGFRIGADVYGPPVARGTFSMVYLDPGSNVIRYLTMETGERQARLPLQRHRNGGMGVLYRDRVLDAEEFAELVVKDMVRKVKPSR